MTPGQPLKSATAVSVQTGAALYVAVSAAPPAGTGSVVGDVLMAPEFDLFR